MKEVENEQTPERSSDAIRHQQAGLFLLVESADKYAELKESSIEAEIIRLREVHSQKLSKEAQLMNLPFPPPRDH